MGDGVSNGSVIDFSKLTGVHYARVVLLEETVDLDGQPLPAQLLLMSDLDISPSRHLRELVSANGDGHRPGLRALRGLHAAATGSGYLRRHVVQEQARYVNTVGRTVEQITQEAQLREAIQRFLDESRDDWSRIDPGVVRARVRELVEHDPGAGLGAPARRAAGRPREAARDACTWSRSRCCSCRCSRSRCSARRSTSSLLRRREKTDPAPHLKPSEERVASSPRSRTTWPRTRSWPSASSSPAASAQLTLRVVDPRRSRLRHPPRLQPRRPRRREDDPLRALGLPRRQAADVLRQSTTTAASRATWTTSSTRSRGASTSSSATASATRARGGSSSAARATSWRSRTTCAAPGARRAVWYAAYGNLTAVNIQQNERIRAGLYGDLDRDQELAWVRATLTAALELRRHPGARRPRLRRPAGGALPAARGRRRGRGARAGWARPRRGDAAATTRPDDVRRQRRAHERRPGAARACRRRRWRCSRTSSSRA